MKKLLSVILVLVMLLSSVTVIAVADDIEDVTDGAPPINDESPEATEESSENSSDESDVSEPPVNDDITDEDDFTQDDEPLDDSEEETSGADEVVTEPEETTTEETTTEEATTEETTTEEATTEEATTEEITTEPDPFENVPAKLMCDVNNDGKVKADDARLILRCSVALEAIAPESLVYADYDLNGKVTAADARMALRTSVDLEKEVSRKFIVSDKKTASCTEDGYVKAKCNDPEKSVEITISKLQHDVSELIYCAGEDTCKRCGKLIEVPEKHLLKDDPCNGKTVCSRCGYVGMIEVSHKFENGICTVCKYMTDSSKCFDTLVSHIKNNGKLEDGVYYIDISDEFTTYSLCYSTKNDVVCMVCPYGINMNGTTVSVVGYTFIPRNFKDYFVEVECIRDETLIAYAVYSIDPLEFNEEGRGVSRKAFEAVPELNNMGVEIARIAEGMAFDSLNCLFDYAQEHSVEVVNEKSLGFRLISR